MQSFVFSKIVKFSTSTFNRPTILQNLRSYKKSAAQSHLHDYIRDQSQLAIVKKQQIDSDFITKQSAGIMMFREFAFQQKTEQTLVPHMNCYLAPSSAWTLEQIKKELGDYDDFTKTQQLNIQVMDQCQSDIQKAIKQYYANVGKKNYQFNLQQEINKINQMTDQQFKLFSNILHNKDKLFESTESQSQKTVPKSRKY